MTKQLSSPAGMQLGYIPLHRTAQRSVDAAVDQEVLFRVETKTWLVRHIWPLAESIKRSERAVLWPGWELSG